MTDFRLIHTMVIVVDLMPLHTHGLVRGRVAMRFGRVEMIRPQSPTKRLLPHPRLLKGHRTPVLGARRRLSNNSRLFLKL